MPPIKSSRPGARVTKRSPPPSSKKPYRNVVSPARRRPSVSTKSAASPSPSVEPCTILDATGRPHPSAAQKPAALQSRAQQRLDLFAHAWVGVADPGHVRLDRE